MTSTLSLNRRCNLSWKNSSNKCEQTGRHPHLFTHWSKKHSNERLHSCAVKFLVFKPYLLQIYFTKPTRTLQKHPFFNFSFIKILKDCHYLISLGTRSHIFDPRNETDFVPCLTEFTLHLCNVCHFGENCMGRAQIYHLKWVEKNHA